MLAVPFGMLYTLLPHYIHAIHLLASRTDRSNRQLHYGTGRVTRVPRLHCRVHDCRYFLSHPSACIRTLFIRCLCVPSCLWVNLHWLHLHWVSSACSRRSHWFTRPVCLTVLSPLQASAGTLVRPHTLSHWRTVPIGPAECGGRTTGGQSAARVRPVCSSAVPIRMRLNAPLHCSFFNALTWY